MDFVFENSRPGNSMEVDEKFWKKVESFGKFLFRKGCFLFFRAGARSRRSRPAQALAKRCTFDLTVSCHGRLVHFRSRRGRGPLVHASRSRTSTRACSGHHTHRKDYKEGGRNAFDCVSLFLTWGQLGEVFLCVSRIAAARLTRNGKVQVFNAVAF